MGNIEMFEVYYFDGVFYTKEEIEQIGLHIYSYQQMKDFLGTKNENYKIIKIYNEDKHSKLLINEILENPKANVIDLEYIFFNEEDYLKIIDFVKYYSIQFNDIVYLACSSVERNEKLADLQNLIENKIYSFRNSNFFNKETEYEAQQKIISKKKKLAEIIPSK